METKIQGFQNPKPGSKAALPPQRRLCPPFPEREIVRPGPRRQGIGFASLRALGRLRAEPGGSLFMRERGELQRGENPPGRGCTNERFCNPLAPDELSRT